jgi:hypothetical protein
MKGEPVDNRLQVEAMLPYLKSVEGMIYYLTKIKYPTPALPSSSSLPSSSPIDPA